MNQKIGEKIGEKIIGHKSPDIQPGYIYLPYIPISTEPTIQCDLLDKAQKKVTAYNRERKIDSILEDIEYIPMDIKETDEYKEFEERYLTKKISSRYALAIKISK